ncbi:hypothetical protein [Xanthovirga aplysinae]|uniref:hypothetical protein n=1 Tax=Xanthovirga aplysinae TaxID=2529853 RepID=UPI0012BC46CC|nr:hypothetical protein [Xanthovirga aplysinae]MTI29985.1 hypothetical protein [Xanthovirga aplysinae]
MKAARKKHKIGLYLSYLIVVVLFFELSFRMFFCLLFNQWDAFTNPSRLLYKFYPNLEKISKQKVESSNQKIDILFLGGSVLTHWYGNIEEELSKSLKEEYSLPIKIHNVAYPAHTSLDSRIKYSFLKDKAYDMILLYHGINETRFNNCPKGFFQKDYSHVRFYNQIYALLNSKSKYSIFPFLFSFINPKYVKNFLVYGNFFLGQHEPIKKWKKFGEDIKTKKTFFENYVDILEIANKKHIPVIAPTFVHYQAPNYNLDDFLAKKLDYGAAISPIEIWGTPDFVIKGIEKHNEVIKEQFTHKQTYKQFHILDMNKAFPKRGKYFNDICHFTKEGSREFVNHLFPLVKEKLEDHFTPLD